MSQCLRALRVRRSALTGEEAMDASGGDYPVLEVADPQRRESLQRENVPDPLAGEQTWPTAEVRSSGCSVLVALWQSVAACLSGS
jgi:hypothetical protein